MNHTFKVGDLAILCNLVGGFAHHNGLEVEVTDPLQQVVHPLSGKSHWAYGIRLPDGRSFWTSPRFLKPLPPHDTPTTWDECLWRPHRTEEPA